MPQTGRLSSINYPNGRQTIFSYYGTSGDDRLQEIKNLAPSSNVLSQFDYGYDADGEITSWQQNNSGLAAPKSYAPGYDLAGQLSAATLATSGSATNYFYDYDKAGNRNQEQINSAPTISSYNGLNQLTGQSPGGLTHFRGTVDKWATVTVGGNVATLTGTGPTHQFDGTANLTTGTNTVEIVATDLSGSGARTNFYRVVVPSGTGTTLSYDANGNMLNGPSWAIGAGGKRLAYDGMRTISYWQSNKPYVIHDPSATMIFYYGADGSLIKQTDAESQETLETEYLGNYEVVRHHATMDVSAATTEIEMRHYFVGGSGKVAVFTVTDTPLPQAAGSTAGSTGTSTSDGGMELSGTTISSGSATAAFTMQSSFATNYLLTDGLGSTEVITDSGGHVLADGNGTETGRYSYDAWGLRRDAASWGPAGSVIQGKVTKEGFTGHEELDTVQLVHMGGRVYDPVIGRVMTPDPEVQAPQMSQSYNRYSYCVNNPTSLTDPTGNSWLDVFTGGASAIAGAFSSSVRNWGHQLDAWMGAHPIVGEVVIAVAVVVVSVVTYGAAAPAMGAFWGAVMAGAAGGLAQGTMGGVASNESVTQTMESGAEDMAIGAAEAGLTAGVAHGFPGQAGGIFADAGPTMSTLDTRMAEAVIKGGVGMAEGESAESAFISGAASSAGEYADDYIPDSNQAEIALRTVVAGAIGGTASEVTGGSFVNGAVSAAFSHLFNDEYPLFRSNAATPGSETWQQNARGGGRQWYAWTLVGNTNLDSLLGGYYGPWVITSNGTNLCYECMSNWQELTGAPNSPYLYAGPYLSSMSPDDPLLRQGVMVAWATNATWNAGTGSYPSTGSGNHTAFVVSNGSSLTFYHVFNGQPLIPVSGNGGYNAGRAPWRVVVSSNVP